MRDIFPMQDDGGAAAHHEDLLQQQREEESVRVIADGAGISIVIEDGDRTITKPITRSHADAIAFALLSILQDHDITRGEDNGSTHYQG